MTAASPRGPRTWALARWGGAAAAIAMAVSAYLGGSPLHRDLSWRLGIGVWIIGAAALGYAWLTIGRSIGLPIGGHIDLPIGSRSGGPAGPGVRWLLTTAALWAVPLLLAPPLGSQDAYCYACQGQLYRAGFNLYAVGPDAMPCTWLRYVPAIWQSAPVPYGPLWIALSGGAVAVAGGSLAVAVTALRLVAIAGTLLAVAAGAQLARRCGGQPATVAWIGALSPLVLVHDVSGAHNDAILAGLVVTGLAIAAGRPDPRPGAVAGFGAGFGAGVGTGFGAGIGGPAMRVAVAGVAFGLGAGIKVTALVAAPFAVPLVLAGLDHHAHNRRRMLAALAAVLAAAIAATYGALAALTGYGLGFVHALTRTGSMVQWLSPPSGIGMALGYLLRALGWPEAFDTAVAIPRVVALGVLAVALVLLWRWAVRAQRIATVVTAAGLALIATVVLGPVVYAWYAVAGLCVLAATPLPRAGRIAIAAAGAGLIFLTLPDGLGLATKTKGPGAILDVLALIVGIVWWLRNHRNDDPKGRVWLSSEGSAARGDRDDSGAPRSGHAGPVARPPAQP